MKFDDLKALGSEAAVKVPLFHICLYVELLFLFFVINTLCFENQRNKPMEVISFYFVYKKLALVNNYWFFVFAGCREV